MFLKGLLEFLFLSLWQCCTASEILLLRPGTKFWPWAVKAQSPNH